ncbi:hypothetical protein Dimus_038345 [Dionaea muscipula]
MGSSRALRCVRSRAAVPLPSRLRPLQSKHEAAASRERQITKIKSHSIDRWLAGCSSSSSCRRRLFVFIFMGLAAIIEEGEAVDGQRKRGRRVEEKSTARGSPPIRLLGFSLVE